LQVQLVIFIRAASKARAAVAKILDYAQIASSNFMQNVESMSHSIQLHEKIFRITRLDKVCFI
jgi:hypothetical protein